MGLEAKCRARFGGQAGSGTAQLETDKLVFRGELRFQVPLKELQSVKAAGGNLEVRFGGGTAVLELGKAAEKWADKILHPPSRLDKLGVKAGMRVALRGEFDAEFVAEVKARTGDVAAGKPKKDSAAIFLLAESAGELSKVEGLSGSMARDGALWIVYPKGRKEITENGVLAAGRAAGLTDVKVVSFSATHTGLKFVIPVVKR